MNTVLAELLTSLTAELLGNGLTITIVSLDGSDKRNVTRTFFSPRAGSPLRVSTTSQNGIPSKELAKSEPLETSYPQRMIFPELEDETYKSFPLPPFTL
jgi:hypothetical protein